RFSGYRGDLFSGLDILVLSIIRNREGISGYEISQEINKKFKPMWRASPGTIYPLLNRLDKKGFVETEEFVDENNRRKKIYTITIQGIERLKEVLKDNFETSMNTLGDYIRTVVNAWLPHEKRIKGVMSCFPFHCAPIEKKIDEEDYSLKNIERIERILNDLQFSKERISMRLYEIEKEIKKYKDILKDLKKKRNANTKTIPIVDDDEYENF
ncbi:MAG: PadR family transcriptional regulator, partial [Candidatus Lokiarchaeota archaeon]|nr:PadR family transcriptional regulator [Candidatus Lokiarchaeota archaeon]